MPQAWLVTALYTAVMQNCCFNPSYFPLLRNGDPHGIPRYQSTTKHIAVGMPWLVSWL